MEYDVLIEGLKKRAEGVRQSQDELDGDRRFVETWLENSTKEMDSLNSRLTEMKSHVAAAQPSPEKVSSEKEFLTLVQESLDKKTQPSAQDFTAQLEKLLQGSLDALGDKISDKIANLLKELKTTSGPVREAKMREIQEAAEEDQVDLSKLFLFEKVESNIETLGIQEQETKGVGNILDKLRKLKGIKDKKKQEENK